MQIKQTALSIFHTHGFKNTEIRLQFIQKTRFPTALAIFGFRIAINHNPRTHAINALIKAV
ncbi:Uncharacterised protein [Mycobacteroides abscessus subsp. massiliense]|nr:Uncharacterised protein [Mycobacteroides abscessus subsp. massiliense]